MCQGLCYAVFAFIPSANPPNTSMRKILFVYPFYR